MSLLPSAQPPTPPPTSSPATPPSTPRATPPAIDALEQHDPWRDLWQALTGDTLLAMLCVIVALAWGAAVLLPQAPASGTADPLTYSQWQTQARASTGDAFDLLAALGLFSLTQALWFRLVLAILLAVLVLRLLDRVAQLLEARR